jgi:hypothetical protein
VARHVLVTGTVMKSLLRSRCRAPLLALAFGLGCGSSVLAEPLPFTGRWLADDHPEAQVLRIKDASMSWREPACVRQFTLKKEKPGTVYRDGRGRKFVAGALGSMPTYLLKLDAGTCGSPADEMRISFPLVYDINHIELIEYALGKPVSARRLHRKK